MVHTKKMFPKDWIAVRANPIQRDTERHAAKAKHLKTFHPTHAVVHAAELPNGKLVKLDGHTRALLWQRKEVEAPVQLNVVVYPVKDMAEAEQLYQDFDSKDALETTRDKVSGAYNKHDFEPQSGLLQNGNIVSALRMAQGVLLGGSVKTSMATGGAQRSPRQSEVGKASIYAMINEWSYELHTLDGFGLRQGQITAGIIGAFLVSARKYGHDVNRFWTGVFANKGNKIGSEMDGIEAVAQMIAVSKGRGTFSKMKTADTAARALMAVEKWRKDEMLGRMPSPMDTTGYLVGHKRATERLIKKKDMDKARINREAA